MTATTTAATAAPVREPRLSVVPADGAGTDGSTARYDSADGGRAGCGVTRGHRAGPGSTVARSTVIRSPLTRRGRASGCDLRVVPDAGMASAEYAVALIAACAFAAVLLAAIKADAVKTAIGTLITAALRVIT